MTRKKFIPVQDMNLKIQVICIIRARKIFLYRQPAQKKIATKRYANEVFYQYTSTREAISLVLSRKASRSLPIGA